MKKLIREPFIHFILLGAAIFLAYHFLSARADNQPGKIVITQGDITSIMIGFSRTWQRPPTREELEGLIRDRVREEVYYREAIAMGLDRDDPIIRRRLQQKLQFVTDDVAAPAEPTDAELSDYLKTHADVFRVDRKFTFSQVYLDPNKHRDHLAQDANELLIQLRQQGARCRPFLVRRCLPSGAPVRSGADHRDHKTVWRQVRGEAGRRSDRTMVRSRRIGLRHAPCLRGRTDRRASA